MSREEENGVARDLRVLGLRADGLLVGLPGLAAVGLGLLYGLGAFLWTAAIRGAGLSVVDTLPLIPLQQVLARGIGTAVLAAVVGVGMAVGMPLVAFAERRFGPPPAVRPSARKLVVLRVALLVLLAALLVVAPVAIAVVVVTGVMAIAAYLAVKDPGGSLSRRFFPLLSAATVATAALTQAFVDPAPLPRVALTRTVGEPLRGDLVTPTEQTWYVRPAKGRIVAVPASRVTEARVRQRKQHPKTLWKLIFG